LSGGGGKGLTFSIFDLRFSICGNSSCFDFERAALASVFELSDFEFVSDFGIRISDLTADRIKYQVST
jgi:hypothetical protein